MGWLGMPLSMGTSIVGAVALGLAVGFVGLIAGEFRSVVHLGIATASTLILAFGCNWLVLPSLLRLIGWQLGEVELRACQTEDGGGRSGEPCEHAA